MKKNTNYNKMIGLICMVILLVPHMVQASEPTQGQQDETSSWFSRVMYNIKMFLSGSISIDDIVDDTSIKTCLSQVNAEIQMDKEKSHYPIKKYVKEYEKFNNSSSALDYLEYWRFIKYMESGWVNRMGFRQSDWLIVESSGLIWMEYERFPLVKQNDIIIALVKTEISLSGEHIQSLEPYLCIDGEYKSEPMCPAGIYTGVDIKILDWQKLKYNITSEPGNLISYNLTMLDSDKNIIDYSDGVNPSGGLLEVNIEKAKGRSGFTIFEFTTNCGTYTRI